ncbi:OmpA family protein [Metapseudomonas resinovorans]|uniref:OmpA family protein n=1 Tax=Metapseudomonas resinovorans TaxID=53412 RepID=UPI000687848F|nr:OmpA family protein [Pseudomonas resinovorans]
MKRNHALRVGLLFSLGLLGGCANQQQTEQSLEQARQMFQKVKEDQNVLSAAPKDVIRSGESLARAERLSSYWGNDADVVHYAYLSQRYAEIASQHSEQSQNQTRVAKLQLERERLQLALREAKLLSVQQQGKWLEDQMIALAATETDRGLVMTLGDVLFDTGRADLKASANRTVLKLVQFLQLNPRRVVRIEGYTDSSGKKQDNLKLSTDRAQAVADALADLGIDAKRIQVQGYGEAFPVAENASNRGRAQNRRVEIVFSNEKGELGPAR